ncbi:hypothetical protein EG327_003881 [Venturia inaequalis]|uniref:Adenosine deaminase domain-containing protein n=1 Tax=Venturia inaequalis TaxID=5025 RepID=A0A8H3VEK3_VENIN|nr:hypothetical protein EG327_003881 [Venturia inaequalis]
MSWSPPPPDLSDFALTTLPKIELHAHLSGSISRDCLHQIWLKKKSVDPKMQLDDPFVAIPPGKLDYDLTTIRFSTLKVLADFEADGVIYLELRTTPRAIPQHNITKQKYVETVLDCIEKYELDPEHRLHTGLILSVDRRNTLEQANEVVELAKAFHNRGVCAVDLCGDPARIPIDHLAPAFEKARKAGLKVTLHFAEAPVSSSDKELWMLLSWQPDRLGHVINVHDELKRDIVKREIGVELCLSCNVHGKMIKGSYGDHHFGWWKDNHPGVALCTDDVGVFCSPLSQEYALAAKHFNLSKEDLVTLCEGVAEMTFAGEDEKARLRRVYKMLRKELDRTRA